MNLSLRQLEAFAAIARWRNLTRAAEQIHITQAGLSLMLRDMEAQLDCRLFERTTRSVSLTQGGERLLPLAERTLRDFREVADQLSQLSADAARTVHLAATPLVAADVLPQACHELARTHPDIRVVVKDVDRRQIQPMVERGEVDVGVGVLLRESPTTTRELLLRLPLVAVGARGALTAALNGRGTLSWAALRALPLPLLALPADNAIQQLVDARLAPALPREDRPVFAHLHTLIAMAEAGQGVAVLPAFVASTCRRYAVDVHRMGQPMVAMEFFSIARRGAPLTPAAAPLLRALVQHLGRSAAGAT
ncbi:MAG: LysR family transcriptional regulator [Comamonadaceae bacterium]|jgi:DNA-binding transcriptional LysR family regulator|uniref:LysR family transcriptional regulator n=1 Tax=Hydrogenophaga borbori TaxID=2294117 RepID=A0A372EG37_9BURK|nr:LysR family transcriptional regulator [Hydrogenophaga borbori]NCT97463.1 LysR family transcriptional regulator [Comamonadaceae bacterium]RFP77386.1 LysR family transcriptional regulator [Hydrogenophaga borbori]